MIWQDLMLDRWIDEAALRAATASAFHLCADRVVIADTPEQLMATSPSAQVILERTRQHRDFPLQILVVLRDDELARHVEGPKGVIRVARGLAQRLDATVLFAEGPLSPSEWVRVRPTGQVDVVSLDVDETGEVDSFFVVAQRALPGTQGTGEAAPTHLTA